MKDPLRSEQDQTIPDNMDRPLRPLKCKLDNSTNKWPRSWQLARHKGVGPKTSTSFLMKTLWSSLPKMDCLNRVLPANNLMFMCSLCYQDRDRIEQQESLLHALALCPGNQGLSHQLQGQSGFNSRVLEEHINYDFTF